MGWAVGRRQPCQLRTAALHQQASPPTPPQAHACCWQPDHVSVICQGPGAHPELALAAEALQRGLEGVKAAVGEHAVLPALVQLDEAPQVAHLLVGWYGTVFGLFEGIIQQTGISSMPQHHCH